MITVPRKTRYTKYRKGIIKGFKSKNKNSMLVFGKYGIKVMENGRVTDRQLEAARKAIVKQTSRNGQLWVRCSPCYPITFKPTESRMGKGKGLVSRWVFRARAGSFLFEFEGISKHVAQKIFKAVKPKLPVKVILVCV